MTTIHLEHDVLVRVKPFIYAAFPSFNGKNVKVVISADEHRMVNYWDSGSRDYMAFVHFETKEVKHVPQNGSMFDKVTLPDQAVPAGWMLIVNHFRGNSPNTVTIYLNPINANTLALPAPKVLPWNQEVVLTAIRSTKNTYGGKKGLQMSEAMRSTGISAEEYQATFQELIAAGCIVPHNGALTPKGKNMAGSKQLHQIDKKHS